MRDSSVCDLTTSGSFVFYDQAEGLYEMTNVIHEEGVADVEADM